VLIRSRPPRLAPEARAASLAADDRLAAPPVERDAAAGADPARWREPSGMMLVTPDARASGTGHRRVGIAASSAAIPADEGLPPGVDVGGTQPVGEDDGPRFE
jgi:hypothetical protein